MLALQLIFLTPRGGLVALAAGLPAAALAVTARRNARGRTRLGLSPPGPDRTGLGLVLIPLLLGLAAAQPAVQSHADKRLRTDAQALFVFDVSASMAASARPQATIRLEQ